MKLGGIYISVGAKTKKLKRDLAKAEGLTKKTAVLMKQEIGRISFAKVGAAAAAFAAAYAYGMKKAIDAASDLQEVQGKFDVVFARHGNQAESMAKVLVKSYAMSEREAKQYMSSIQDLLVPMGMASDKALGMSNEVVKLSADLASFNNLPTSQVMLDIQSALVGNFETMKKYGVVINETVVKQKAWEMGLWDGKGMVDANIKAQVAFKLILEGSAAAIGDQERTMGSYANQMKKLKANVENMAAAVGDELLPEVTAWINQLNEMIETNPQIITQIADFSKNILGLVATMGKVIAIGAEFTTVWVKTWQALGLASAGTISYTAALTNATAEVEHFNKEGKLTGLSLKKTQELERKLAIAIRLRTRAEEKGNEASVKRYDKRIKEFKVLLGYPAKEIKTAKLRTEFISNLEQKAIKARAAGLLKIEKIEKKINKDTIKEANKKAKALEKLEKDKGKRNKDFSKKYQKLTLGDYKYAVNLLKAEAKQHKTDGRDHLQVEFWLHNEIAKLQSKKAEAAADYAKESIRIYERLSDDVQKLNLGDLEYSKKVLKAEYDNKKMHLEALAKQDSKYFDGIVLLNRWHQEKKNKLDDDWARRHGSVLDRMEVRWRDYQEEAIDANRVMYDAISAGADNLTQQLDDVFFNVLTGRMDKVNLDWDSMWEAMAHSTTEHMARIVTETALDVGAKAAGAGMDWLGTAMGWWAAGSWEIKKQHMAMLHPGEMVIPADMAEKVRASSGANNIGLGEPMVPEASITIPGSFQDIYTDNAMEAAMLSAAKGFAIRTAMNVLMGVGAQVNPLGAIGILARVGFAGYMGTRDAKKLYGMIYGEDAVYNPDQNVQSAMQALDWSNFNADIASKYGIMAINHPGSGREWGRAGGGAGHGGFGGWGGGSFTGGSGATSYGGGGGSFGFAREGGIFSGPESGYPGPIMHGTEVVIPVKGGKVRAEMEGKSADSPELLAEVKKLREETKAGNFASVKNSNKIAKILARFDDDGLPAERSV